MTFSCDVTTLLLKLCSDVITLYFDVTTLPFSIVVQCGVVGMSWQCRDIGQLSFNLGCFDMMLKHWSCDVVTLQVEISDV